MTKSKAETNTVFEEVLDEKDSSTPQEQSGVDTQSKETPKKPEKKPKKETTAQKLAETEKKLAEANENYLRLRADFDNYRKRNATLRTDALNEGKISVISEILTTLDTFERALSTECSDKNYASGMQMIYNMLCETLKNMGVEEIPSEGMFDPSVHEALMQDATEGVESGTITMVLRKGYRFNGKVIRPTGVRVAE